MLPLLARRPPNSWPGNRRGVARAHHGAGTFAEIAKICRNRHYSNPRPGHFRAKLLSVFSRKTPHGDWIRGPSRHLRKSPRP